MANQLVMRSAQPAPNPIPTGTGHLVVGRQPTVIPAIKTGSPANTRASSPAITIPTTQVPVSAEQLRYCPDPWGFVFSFNEEVVVLCYGTGKFTLALEMKSLETLDLSLKTNIGEHHN